MQSRDGWSSAENGRTLGKQAIRLLRISVTDRCNLRCRYCMPAEGVSKLRHSDLLPMEELSCLAAWLCERMGIERVKLTGGEPLVRLGVSSLVGFLHRMNSVKEISITTNGTLLSEQAAELKSAGLSRVNVSLDSLNPERFSEITRGGNLEDTLNGIAAALSVGLKPVKLNAVLQRSTWREDVPVLLDFAAEHDLEIRFIELMRTGTEFQWCSEEYLPATEVASWLEEQQGPEIPMISPPNAPARLTLVRWQGKEIRVGWITPLSHPFCSRCERLRLDARGRVFRCLMDSSFLPLSDLLYTSGEETAIAALMEYLEGKTLPIMMGKDHSMSLIGG